MHDPRAARLLADLLADRLSRRQALSLGLRFGLASPVIAAIMAAAPEGTGAAPNPARATTSRQEADGGTLTVLATGGITDLDPHSAYDNQASMLFLATYEMLLRLRGSSTDQFEPGLAESWEASPDQSTYTFALAAGATFHDGTPCDAQAVRDSFARFLGMGMGPVNVIARFVQDPNQMEVVDPATLRFNLGRPQPLFLAAMASEYGPFVVSPAAIAANTTEEDPFAHEWFVQNMAGTGPYRLEDYDSPNERVVLARFEQYRGGPEAVHFDRIVLRITPENATRRQLLENGEADALTFALTPEDVEVLQGNPDLQVVVYDSTAVGWVHLNAPRLKRAEARRGFSHAFPYDRVIEGAYKGLLARSGALPAGIRGHDPGVFLYPTDLATAKELILAAGFVDGDSFDYVYPAGEQAEAIVAQLFQANVAEMGFVLEVIEVDRTTHGDYLYGDAPAEERPVFIAGQRWWPDYNDPWNHFAPNFRSREQGGTSNAGFWSNPRFDEIMAEAETYTDEARLVDLMKEAQNILTEQDPPCIYYGQFKYYTVLGKGIQGFEPNPLYLGSYPFHRMSRASGG